MADWKQRKNGSKRYLVLLLALSGCPHKGPPPPAMPIYIGDGYGGADGRTADGTPDYKAPSDLKNYWMTDQESMAAFSSWCYRTEPQIVMQQMEVIKHDINDSKGH